MTVSISWWRFQYLRKWFQYLEPRHWNQHWDIETKILKSFFLWIIWFQYMTEVYPVRCTFSRKIIWSRRFTTRFWKLILSPHWKTHIQIKLLVSSFRLLMVLPPQMRRILSVRKNHWNHDAGDRIHVTTFPVCQSFTTKQKSFDDRQSLYQMSQK